jgi:MFS family permease
MASAATILTYTRGYGLFNVKVLIISAFCVFEIGSAICGSAPTSNALIVGRVVAGIGGAGMYLGQVIRSSQTRQLANACSALTYVSTFTTRAETPIYNALIGISWGVGSILGPVVGGLFSVSSATWRWVRDRSIPGVILY